MKKIDLTKFRTPSELVLSPSSACNLNCKHCSYLCDSHYKDNVPLDQLKNVVDDAISEGVDLFILLGKEPLLEFERTKEVIEHLESKNAKFGMVTNGTLIKERIEELKKHHFDYFDISIDGLKDAHDKTRGEGNFVKAEEGVELVLKNNLTNKFFISSVVMSWNYKNIPEMIKHLNSKGVKNFSMGLYIHTGFNPKEWIITKAQVKELIEDLSKINPEEINQIILDVHTQTKDYWDWLIEEKIIEEAQVKADKNNNIYYRIPNSKIFLKNSYYTTLYKNVAILTADGYWLDNYKHFFTKDYKKEAIGHISKIDFKKYLEKIKENYLKP
jgi:MoaA/NifB/PqqE/SkfB family radical SAM enzyme